MERNKIMLTITMDEETRSRPLSSLISFLIFVTGSIIVAGESLETDREILMNLKSFLESNNKINRGRYSSWSKNNPNTCTWEGISCDQNNSRVTGINLAGDHISGGMFTNFSSVTELTHLDLSRNTLSGSIPYDLNSCKGLKLLNLSHNILEGQLNLSGLISLETLDLSVNRFSGEIESVFSREVCGSNLVVVNISGNKFSGRIDSCFEECLKLKHLDLSLNKLTGDLWLNLWRLEEFSVSQNDLNGSVSPLIFEQNCTLMVLDLSENHFSGEFPGKIENCRNLVNLNLWGNNFTGLIPSEIGSISGLESLFLGRNKFSREIPQSLVSLEKLVFLDLSRIKFGGDVQEIFGKFTQVKSLGLHGNLYTGGLVSSGILTLPNISRLDISINNFSGPLPVELSGMMNLEYLFLACNQFTGNIPSEIGLLRNLQALDLSYNNLTGSIPTTFGKLTSLLWLMLANNKLTGEIPSELGNCSSLLWLNLADNQFSGKIPSELTSIGVNSMATFEANRQKETVIASSGECLAMKRWIPANYPPFSFVYSILTTKSCRSIWNSLLLGYGIFPICQKDSGVRNLQISGYIQLSGNQLSGEVTSDVSKMQNFSMLSLGSNRLSGKLPPEISQLPLVVLNISKNNFSGEIPVEIGNMKCLQNLDLSYNNFSGIFPTSLNKLTELNKFNISYNPLISGFVPSTGQLSTFEKDSYLGDLLLRLPNFLNITPSESSSDNSRFHRMRNTKLAGVLEFLGITLAIFICGVLAFIVCSLAKNPSNQLNEDFASNSVKIVRLDKTSFTEDDILKATANFSEERIIGKGGFGMVYKGVLQDGRQIAVKKLVREGIEGEKEFQAEMEVLSKGWPHPNLVTLYGWCLNGSEKILVYEFMEGGTLEDLILDRVQLTSQRRMEVITDIARALVFLHHNCFPAIVHRDVKAGNVLLDKTGKARVTDFGLARVVDVGESHVSTMVAGTIGYVAPEYGQTWKATTKGDVYSFGVLAMELAMARRALDGGDECLVDWARRVIGSDQEVKLGLVFGSGFEDGLEEMLELLQVGLWCTAESPRDRPSMQDVLDMLTKISSSKLRK